jgi:hypothetical protein
MQVEGSEKELEVTSTGEMQGGVKDIPGRKQGVPRGHGSQAMVRAVLAVHIGALG